MICSLQREREDSRRRLARRSGHGHRAGVGPIGLGGGLASVFARLFVYPVDVLRTVFVTKGREGVRKLRPRDLYRGLGLASIDAFTYHAANFGVYEFAKGMYWRLTLPSAAAVPALGAPLPALAAMFLGMLSGGVGMVACYPFTTVILRMSSEQESMSEALRSIVQHSGMGGLWRGLLAALLMCPRPGLAFVVVEFLQPLCISLRGGRPLSAWLAFVIGAIADAVSTAAIWPLSYARITEAVGSSAGDGVGRKSEAEWSHVRGRFARIIAILRQAIRDHGPLRVYFGLKEELVGISLKGGLRWMVKPRFDQFALAVVFGLLGRKGV